MTCRFILSIAVLALTMSRVAQGQLSIRGAVSFVGDRRPAAQLGGEDRGQLGSGSSSVDSMGVTHLKPTKWLWSAMGLAGVTWARSEPSQQATPRVTAQGQVGALYRASSSTRVGAYAVGLAEPQGIGAIVRAEPFSTAALQAGWLHRRTRPADVAVVQLDVALSFITDFVFGGSRK